MVSTEKRFEKLVEIMSRLRGPGGCPWDRKQTHETLKSYLIEEAYEACDAVDRGDDRELCEELGDVLLQVVFHAQVAAEEKRFNIDDVIEAISQKLISRHPHVFGDLELKDAEAVLDHWQKLKAKEKEEQKQKRASILEGVPRQLPALMKAHRIQQRVARVGFDWEKIEDVFAKLKEEVGEFETACLEKDDRKIEEELGDLFFAAVNVARYLEKDPEEALHRTIDKFIRRFNYIEQQVEQSGKDLHDAGLEEMDRYWEEAKGKESVE